ncbi:hypothetical protein DFH08DRAFT_824661 [Mycena albidolilacea]|uniref:Uncharacterized protein n=1 Tax=Mycena albidolilacea TaxID=1033008 RepID=A0AAD6Z3R9_9AGAR|nr:hypothetical protein DFH08DRAFT_824661 [Mycena albidolilacea]
MPPRRGTSAAQPLSTQTDVAPRRTTRGKSGTSGNPPTGGTSEPTQHTASRFRAATSQQEPRGFAPTAVDSPQHLLVMSAQAAMASPGPRLHAPGAGSDGESEPGSNAETSDSETGPLPVRRMPAWRPRPLAQDDEEIVISLNSDDDTAEPVPSRRKHHSDKWHGFSVDGDSFAWAEATALEKSQSPDCLYFYGQHTESRAYKCRLCS